MGIQNGSESASALIEEQVVVRFWVGRHRITAGRVVQSKKCLRDSGAARLARVTHPEDSSCVAETPVLFLLYSIVRGQSLSWQTIVPHQKNGANKGVFAPTRVLSRAAVMSTGPPATSTIASFVFGPNPAATEASSVSCWPGRPSPTSIGRS